MNRHEICNKMAKTLLNKSVEGNEDYEITKLCFYFEVVVSELESFLILMFLFMLLGFLKEYMLCFFGVTLTRTYVGGLHMKKSISCLMTTLLVYIVAIVGNVYISINMILTSIIFAIDFILIYKWAPVPSPQRPRYEGKKRIKIRNKGIFCLATVIILKLIFASNILTWIVLLQAMELLIVSFILTRDRREKL